MKKVRKYRLYAKYGVDLWGWFLHQRTKGSGKVLAKILYRNRQLRGWKRGYFNEQYELWKRIKPRKGFGHRRSVYKKQLQEKQKTQHFYGFVKEKQLKQIYKVAKSEKGLLENNFSGYLESRLLTMGYRLGFFDSMRVGLQYIQHHGLVVDGRRIKKPNYLVVPGESLEIVKEDLDRVALLRKKTTGHRTHPFFPFWTLFSRRKRIKISYENRIRLIRLYGKEKVKEFLKQEGPLFFLPRYFEFSPLLMKAMYVYRPKSKEIPFPYQLNLLEVVSYFKHH
jgi:ribosomal protein S4